MFLCSFELYALPQTHARRKRHTFLQMQSVRGTKVFMGLDVFFLHSAGGYLQLQKKINSVICQAWLISMMVKTERSQ